ncbi:hypothetical protein [Nonomuraea rubra]|uniref:hypothetical protein n=1 Tax=Nonomuraea rubra TaxID=46180 RepID=UPI003617EDC8
MGRYASVDWIQFEWDEQRTGLGPGRTSLEQTGGWYHRLGPWLDPGPEPGVSLCRLLVDGRVVVLARTRTGGADSRRTIRVQAYLGGSASRPMAMPNVRQTLALAAGWAARLPDKDEPLDLGKLISSYDGARAALDRESRAAASALAPIVSECLRRPGAPLSVASGGNPIVQLWGLVDILDLALGSFPRRSPRTRAMISSRGRRSSFCGSGRGCRRRAPTGPGWIRVLPIRGIGVPGSRPCWWRRTRGISSWGW